MASKLLVVSVLLLSVTSFVVFAREVEFRSSDEHHGLRPILIGSDDFQVLAKRFIMVNCKEKDEENPIYRPDKGAGGVYTPDGDYTPRIFFYDADGNRMDDIINEYGNRAFKYYYPPSEVALRALIRSMKTVLDITTNGRRAKELPDKDEL